MENRPPPDDARRALGATLARLAAAPRPARRPILAQLLPHLADQNVPAPARLAVAARVLKLVPDRPGPVTRVARAVTQGLSRSRALERLRQLQSLVEKCDALDALVERRGRRLRLGCPRCRIRLPPVEMVKHLWHEHGVFLEDGKIRSVGRLVDDLRARHAATGDPGPLDRVAALAGAGGLRGWLAAEEPPADELAPLLASAAGRGAGLCPACFAELPAAVTPLPEPLALARGRLAGDGYAVEAGGNAWFRFVRVTTPGTWAWGGPPTLAPRAAGTLAAAAVLVVTLLAAWTPAVAAGGVAIALAVYALVRSLREDSRTPADRAVDAAWERIAAKLADRPHAARFLTRLCRASTGRGDPEVRARVLAAVAGRAAGKADESDAELQLLAAARVLQVEDLARYGRDVVAGIAALAAEAFAGALPADAAEFVVACYLSPQRPPGDLARLRVLLLGAAFEAGLVPRDLVELWAGAPSLRRAMAVEPAHRLGLFHGVWRTRTGRAWEAVAPAVTVFDLARAAPPTAARVLARVPDVLLFHRAAPAVDGQLGPVLVCARGVSVGGFLAADPDAGVRLSRDGRELTFGPHRLAVARPLPDDLPAVLAGWLRFRAEALLPFIDGYLAPGAGDAARRVLSPFCRRCPACGTVSAVAAGEVGRAEPV
jgi:hypothetical protein